MYKLTDFKERIKVTDTSVECPIKFCNMTVERQRNVFRRLDKFKCPIHNIYISPSTIEYFSEAENLLWTDKKDQDLLKQIKIVKRSSRISRENSEDAVTWNVFRYLERNNLLNNLLSLISDEQHNSIELILWSYSQRENSGWLLLNEARSEFGENIIKGSEPDIIIITDKTLFFIEAKVQASNNTTPSNPNNKKNYVEGGQNWFSQVFNSDYQTIAISNKKYELMRFWLLGSWIANELSLNFQLINLVLADKELLIVNEFSKYIRSDSKKIFSRLTWENIYNMVNDLNKVDNETKSVLDYFKNKSAGFGSTGKLRKRFKSIN